MTDWKPNKRVEEQYAQDIFEILKQYFSPQGKVRFMSAEEFYRRFAVQAAQRMITGLFYGGAKTWRSAARHSMRGREIYEALRHELRGSVGRQMMSLVKSNAQYISSLPMKMAEQATKRAAETYIAGERFETILSAKIFQGLTLSRARLIARTEVSKASTALTRVRAENVGLKWYVWETSQDQRVRPAHRKMQGVLVNFDEPPAPELLVGLKSVGHYAAGDIWNCRCYPRPLIYVTEVNWPHRVYYGGRLAYMTLAEFKRINNFNTAAAYAA